MKLNRKNIIYAGFIVHILTAYFSLGFHQCDELFQVFEFAGYKLGINQAAELPWEYAEQMRSGVEPLMVYAFTKLFHAVSITNPFVVATFLRLLMAVLSFFAMVRLLALFEEELVTERAKLFAWSFSLLAWCLPYFHARLSSENVASTLFLYALILVLTQLKKTPKALPFIAAGFLLGLSFVCRFQMAFMIAGLLGWLLLVNRGRLSRTLFLLAGILPALGAGILVDKWLYNDWVLSWWNYLYQNVVENKASSFGEEPFYFYIGEGLLQLIPPFSLVIVAALLGYWIKFRTHILTWITLPFIVLHFFVAHKELRFLFPALNFLPLMVVLYFQSLREKSSGLLTILRSKGFIGTAITVNALILLFYTFKPANETLYAFEKIYTLVEGENPVLYYERRAPYNPDAGLNYFRKASVSCVDINADSVHTRRPQQSYFFSERFSPQDTLVKQGRTFVRIYTYLPAWLGHLNFNGWLDRATAFSIYRER